MSSSGIEACSGSHVRRRVRKERSRMVCLQEASFFIRDLQFSSTGGDCCASESCFRFTIVVEFAEEEEEGM